VADDAFLRQSYDVYAEVEEQFGQALEESLDPAGPGVLYDLVAGFGLPADAAALDVGCGEGGDAIELARRFGLTVLGIDPVPRHIGIARAELARTAEADPRLARLVAFEQGKAGTLPVGDQSADLLWCRDVLVHVDDLAGAYGEFRRVLRPGGRALIYQMFATELLEPREAAWLLPTMGCAATSPRRRSPAQVFASTSASCWAPNGENTPRNTTAPAAVICCTPRGCCVTPAATSSSSAPPTTTSRAATACGTSTG
jgi:SAM-dependent methyltransferase